MTRHAVRRQLRLMKLDQVFHLPALAVNVLVKMLRGALERSDDITDVDLLAHAGRDDFSGGVRSRRALQPRHHLARPCPAVRLVHEARIGAQLRLAACSMMETDRKS